MFMKRRIPNPRLLLALVLLPANGCATLGSLFSVGSLFSLVPGPQGPPGMDGMNGTNGTNGTNGMNGADGSLRIYGDGSLGDITVTNSTDLLALVPSRNFQFRNLTIAANGSLIVPSGAVIRCSETFTNNGIINVDFAESDRNSQIVPGAGISHQVASNGEFATAAPAEAGQGGDGVSEAEATFILTSDPRGGGAGAGPGRMVLFNSGNLGGGRFIVLARNSITNSGPIDAGAKDGTSGAGGGGGGILILASAGSVTNTSTGQLIAHGGNGGDAEAGNNVAGGGGGGGGIVHLLAPTITNMGSVDVLHGGGGNGTSGTPGICGGGGGGGASGGNGGPGGPVLLTQNPNIVELHIGNDGDDGYFIQTIGDPTSLF